MRRKRFLVRVVASCLVAAGVAACEAAGRSPDSGPGTPLRDDLGRPVPTRPAPARIVSLVPAVTEILYALDAGDRLVGRSVWDDQPPEVRAVPAVGDGLRADLERVLERRPDLVILHAGPDDRRTAERLQALGVPSFAVRLNGLEDLYRTAARLGRLLDRTCEAARLEEDLRSALERVRRAAADRRPLRVYYDVAWPPAITVGGGSYLDELLRAAGARNVFGDVPQPSPRVALEALVARDPDVILLPVSEAEPAPVPPARRPGW
ncbi:MAG: helical backbone metal receptor, partial [Gemmatimonadota bacterium]|nr:helical backbone metal receptor [Gemmatimonadota bacterium]